MSNPNFTLTYDELLLLLKEAYRNGYATYEMTAAGLERYDDDGYARWVLLGMESNKILTSNKDKDIFFNELLNPSEPNKALKDAVAKYKMKPTAVEWLFEQISKSPYYYKLIEHIESKDTIRKPKNIFQQAKQMEDEQLFEYWNGGMQSTEEGGVSFDVYHNGDDNEKLHLSVVSDLLASTDMDTMCQQLQMEVNASETQKYYKSKEVQDLDNPTDVVDEYESMGNLDKMSIKNQNGFFAKPMLLAVISFFMRNLEFIPLCFALQFWFDAGNRWEYWVTVFLVGTFSGISTAYNKYNNY